MQPAALGQQQDVLAFCKHLLGGQQCATPV
jgi:hypothetical protein